MANDDPNPGLVSEPLVPDQPPPSLGGSPPPFSTQQDAPAALPQASPEELARQKKRDEMTDKAANLAIQAGEQNLKDAAGYRQDVRPVVDQAMQAAKTPFPHPPVLEKIPPVPQMAQVSNEWLTAAFVFSALAGAMVRGNSTAALSAIGGMSQGMIQGRNDVIAQNFEQWKLESQRAKETNSAKLEEYRVAMENRNAPIEQAKQQIAFIAAKYQDTMMMEAAQKDFATAASLYDRQTESQLRFEKATLAINNMVQTATMKSQALISDDQAWAMAQRAYAGDYTAMTTIGGRGLERQANFNKINSYINYLMKQNGDPPDKIAKMNAQMRAFAAGQSSEARAGGTRAAQLNMVTKVLEQAIPQAQAASNQLGRTNWVTYNKAIQAGRSEFSDPVLANFNTVNIQLSELWARAMNPTGAMRQGDRDLALTRLRAADGPRAYNAVLNALREAVKREQVGVEKARQEMPGGGGAQQAPITATGPNGKKLILQNGQWTPMQ